MRRALAVVVVAAQFALLAALTLVPHGSLWPRKGLIASISVVLLVGGAILIALGGLRLGPAFTASPIPKRHAPLATKGVYGLVRNPIYTGLMCGGLALALLGASVWHAVLWVALVVLHAGKARWEERMLAAEHTDYREYARRVGRFVPFIGRLHPPR